MKVRMLTSMAGRDYAVNKGDIHECDEAEGIRLIDAGIAEPADAPKETDRSSKVTTEKRAPRAKKRSG